MANQSNRVLVRAWARELTPQEAEIVNGGRGTTTLCSLRPPNVLDGDLGEC